MSSGPTYGRGFIDLEPRLETSFLNRINSQLERVFSNVRLDIDTSSVRAVTDQLERMERTSEEARTNLVQVERELSDSGSEARELATSIGRAQSESNQLEGDVQGVERKLSAAGREARELARQMGVAGDSSRGVGRLDSALTSLQGRLVGVAAAAVSFFGARGIISQAQVAVDSFTALGESVNAVQVVFGEGAEQIFEFSEGVADAAGLAKSEFQQMSTILGAALQNAGFEAGEAAEKTIFLTQRAADMASVLNSDVSEALGAIQAALRGETDPIERFGVSLSAAAVEAQAAALGFQKVGGEFDNTAKIAARLSLIIQQTERFSGDFANTSDSLANSQRRAAAATENFRAEVGEQLAPAFAALNNVIPEVLEGIRQLVPSFAAAADSAAGFFESIGNVDDGGTGFRQIGAEARILGGTLGDVAGGIGDFFTVIGAKVAVQTDAATRAMDRLGERGARFELRDLGVTLARQLDQGTKATEAFTTAVVKLGKNKESLEVFQQGYRDFAIQANLSNEDLLLATENILAMGEASGLSAEEIAELELQLSILRAVLNPIANQEIAQANRAMEGLGRTIVREVSPGLHDIVRDAEDAGVSLEDLAFSLDPIAQSFRDALNPAEQTELRFKAIGSSAEVAAGILGNTLRPTVVHLADAFVDLNDDGKVSVRELIRNVEDLADASLAARVDLANVARLAPEVAAELASRPEEIRNEFLKKLRENPEDLAELQAALLGDPEDIAESFRGVVGEAIALLASDPSALELENWAAQVFPELSPGEQNALTDILQGALDQSHADLEAPETRNLLAESVDGWSSVELAAAVEGLFENSVRQIDVDLTQSGVDARRSFMIGLNTPGPGEISRLRDSIVRVVDGAIIRQSPPKLFRDAGEDSIDAFWLGVNSGSISPPQFNLSRMSLGAALDVTTDSGTGGPLIGQMTVNNPIGEPSEDSLQAALIEVAVSPTVNRLVSAGSSR